MDESDLRSALAVLADRAPETRSAAAQADRRVARIRSTRRRVGLLGIAAAVIVVAGASGMVALGRPTPAGPPAATSGSTLRDAPGETGRWPGQSVGPRQEVAAKPGAAPQPLLGYGWTTPGGGPELPVRVEIPAGYTSRQMKFYPYLDYSTITYAAPGTRLAGFSVTVGKPEAFVESTGGAQTSTPPSRPSRPATTQRRGVTTASGTALLVEISSPSAALARSLAASIAVTATPTDLGIHLSQIPAGAYIGGARTDPADPLALAAVDLAGPEEGGGSRTLTLRTSAGLPAPAESVRVRALDGQPVMVFIGADTTSWVLLGDGRAIVLTGYPLSGMVLRDALAFPQSTLLPLLAGSTPSH